MELIMYRNLVGNQHEIVRFHSAIKRTSQAEKYMNSISYIYIEENQVNNARIF
jgi:hypothetical protein